jgi:hypothetical protein
LLLVPSLVAGDTSFWKFLQGNADSTWVGAGVTVGAGLALCLLLTQPGPLSFVLTNTGMARAQAMRIARSAARRALLPVGLFMTVIAVCDYGADRTFLLGNLAVTFALGTALVLDTMAAFSAQRRGGWVRVWRDPRPELVAVAARKLVSEGIVPYVGTKAQSALLRAFGAYAPTEIHVQTEDVKRARKLVKQAFTGPPDEDPGVTETAETGTATTASEVETMPLVSKLETRLAILALVAVVATAVTH